jgi:hypothetical protein
MKSIKSKNSIMNKNLNHYIKCLSDDEADNIYRTFFGIIKGIESNPGKSFAINDFMTFIFYCIGEELQIRGVDIHKLSEEIESDFKRVLEKLYNDTEYKNSLLDDISGRIEGLNQPPPDQQPG